MLRCRMRSRENLDSSNLKTKGINALISKLINSQCFMWFVSHFTVGVTRRLLLSSPVSSLVINLLTF